MKGRGRSPLSWHDFPGKDQKHSFWLGSKRKLSRPDQGCCSRRALPTARLGVGPRPEGQGLVRQQRSVWAAERTEPVMEPSSDVTISPTPPHPQRDHQPLTSPLEALEPTWSSLFVDLSAPRGKAPCLRQHCGLCRPQVAVGQGGLSRETGRTTTSELELDKCPYSSFTNEAPKHWVLLPWRS